MIQSNHNTRENCASGGRGSCYRASSTRNSGRGSGGGRRYTAENRGDSWHPCTKLGLLVKDGKIKSLDQIFLHAIPIKEYQIVDYLIGSSLKDSVVKIERVQKQTTS